MSQKVTLSISGIDTSLNDYQGLPAGALDAADNAEIRFPNLLQARRGFEGLTGSGVTGESISRLTNFPILGVDRVISLATDGSLYSYNGTTQTLIAGDYSQDIENPDDQFAKSRFILAGQNLYTTSKIGIRSLAAGSGSQSLLAGVPPGLNVSAVVDTGTTDGILSQNIAAEFTGQLRGATAFASYDALYFRLVAHTAGATGNTISLELATGAALSVSVTGNAIKVTLNTGVSTYANVVTAINGNVSAAALVTASNGYSSSTIAAVKSPAFLTNGVDADASDVVSLSSITGIEVGDYIYADPTFANITLNALLFTAKTSGTSGNSITITTNYTAGSGAAVVSVVGSAITIALSSTANTTVGTVMTALLASSPASALVSVQSIYPFDISAATFNPAPATYSLSGGSASPITSGTTVTAINEASVALVTTGNINLSQPYYILNLQSITGVNIGDDVTGTGILSGAKVLYLSNDGTGTFLALLSQPFNQNVTGGTITFTRPASLTLSANASAVTNLLDNSIYTYKGAQAAYVVVYGRTETDGDGNTITRIGTPSDSGICTNITPEARNVSVTTTLPKNAENLITFVRLYRSPQTAAVNIDPLAQYQLAFERTLVAGDFTARVITLSDTTPDGQLGIPMYSGEDQEGETQENDVPPSAWDMCTYKDFALYGNITQPSNRVIRILGAGPSTGVQINDTITISGTLDGVAFTRTYTGKATESQASRQFAVVTSGTPSQNITDTAASLIRVINYDEALPIHALKGGSSIDLPGAITLVSDYPTTETFTTTSSRPAAFDPPLSSLASKLVIISQGIAVSKVGELEAVPVLNLLNAGNSTNTVLRVVNQRAWVLVVTTQGLYRIQGESPSQLTCVPFDLTVRCIGPDTVVTFASAIWMLSQQGIVRITDSGVQRVSIQVDNDILTLISQFRDNIIQNSFAVAYEADSKYILCIPNNSDPFTNVQYNYNTLTQAYTTWSRNIHFGYVHTNDGKLYVSCADTGNEKLSRERKSGTDSDYIDESISVNVVSQVGAVVTLTSAAGIEVGDILFQTIDGLFSPVLSVDTAAGTITLLYNYTFNVGAQEVQKKFVTSVTWKQVFGENPASVKQFSEGLVLFKNKTFPEATLSFVTDFSTSSESTTITGNSQGAWGLFLWGEVPWGGQTLLPETSRFYIPQNKQLASYILPTLSVSIARSSFKLQGMSITYYAVNQEVGVT